MNELIFSRKSWAYRFICFMNDDYKFYEPSDICEFGRALVFQFLKFLGIIGLAGFMMIALGMCVISANWLTFMGLGMRAFEKLSVFSQVPIAILTGIVTAVSIISLLFLVLFIWNEISEAWCRRRYDKKAATVLDRYTKPKKPDGPIVAAYRAWKEKTCCKIRFD